MKTYTQDYVDAARARTARQAATFVAETAITPEFESVFFNNLLVVLDAAFVHRSAEVVLGDGNPLNEVKLIVASLLENDEKLGAGSQIVISPQDSVLGLVEGESIRLDRGSFMKLAAAFFADLEAKFVTTS